MISFVENVNLFSVSASRSVVQGVDNKILAEEILQSQQRLSSNPVLPLFEDTVFDPAAGSEGDKLMSLVRSLAGSFNASVVEQWSQIHQPLESTGLHNHFSERIQLAFVYYVKVPPGAGYLCFEFEGNNLATIAPKEGELYIFPSWAKHKVTKNLSPEIRISVAGNLAFNN